MADNTIEIVEPLEFHPCHSPRGILHYTLELLTTCQQTKLNEFKRNLIRENERYLAKHPEIRALIALVLHHVLKYRPRTDVAEFMGRFFNRSPLDIRGEMEEYIHARGPHVYEGDSALGLEKPKKPEEAVSVSELTPEEEGEIEHLEMFPREVLDDILHKAYDKMGIDFATDEAAEVSYDDIGAESIVSDIIAEFVSREGTTVADEGSMTQDLLYTGEMVTEGTEISEELLAEYLETAETTETDLVESLAEDTTTTSAAEELDQLETEI